MRAVPDTIPGHKPRASGGFSIIRLGFAPHCHYAALFRELTGALMPHEMTKGGLYPAIPTLITPPTPDQIRPAARLARQERRTTHLVMKQKWYAATRAPRVWRISWTRDGWLAELSSLQQIVYAAIFALSSSIKRPAQGDAPATLLGSILASRVNECSPLRYGRLVLQPAVAS